MFPKFLQPEVFPYRSVEIIPAVEQTIEDAQRARFRRFLSDPATGPKLDALLAENAAIDAAARPTRCAWCPSFDPTAITNAGRSHGMCVACAARFGSPDVQLVPVRDTGIVVDVAIEPLDDDDAGREEDCGATCGAACGYCGRCS